MTRYDQDFARCVSSTFMARTFDSYCPIAKQEWCIDCPVANCDVLLLSHFELSTILLTFLLPRGLRKQAMRQQSLFASNFDISCITALILLKDHVASQKYVLEQSSNHWESHIQMQYQFVIFVQMAVRFMTGPTTHPAHVRDAPGGHFHGAPQALHGLFGGKAT